MHCNIMSQTLKHVTTTIQLILTLMRPVPAGSKFYPYRGDPFSEMDKALLTELLDKSGCLSTFFHKVGKYCDFPFVLQHAKPFRKETHVK